MSGHFVLSLDFEGMWGSLGSRDVAGFAQRTQNLELVLNRLIDLIEKYQIHCTWAIVGALACSSPEQVLKMMDYDITYPQWDTTLSDFIKTTGSGAFYFERIVDRISKCNYQEIGSHTFTHSYFLDSAINCELAEKELALSRKVLEKYTSKVDTVVFPRNQFNKDYLPVLEKTGYSVCRSNPNRFFMGKKHLRKIHSLLEFANCYFPLSRKVCFSNEKIQENHNIITVPYSFFLRFYDSRFSILEPLKIRRIKCVMTKASKQGKTVHLWFHPHNLGEDVERNFNMLEEVFHHFKELNMHFGMDSMTIREIADFFYANR